MSRTYFCIPALLLTVVLVSCDGRNQPAGPSSAGKSESSNAAPASSAASNIADQWLGKWIGPEGTFLVLAKNGTKYVVEVHSLDGAATYHGAAVGNHVEFERNGKTESLHSGGGQETGMKWLLEKKNCLIIRTGEGFCRD
jgi:hypothetical protein